MRVRSYLLDTNILIWMGGDPERISASLRATLDRGKDLYLSPASVWEVATKRAAGKLNMTAPLSETAGRLHLVELPITIEHGEAAGSLPRHHGDPFDRLLVAQAQIESLVLVSSDVLLQRYDVDLLLV